MVIVSGKANIRIHRSVKGLPDKPFGGDVVNKDRHDGLKHLSID